MLYQFNGYFHYFFVTFFAVSAVLFWYLDRKRWADYRRAAASLSLRFTRDVAHQIQQQMTGRFDFFCRDNLQVFSTLFRGTFQAREVAAFHYAFQGQADEFSFRRGFACFTMASEVPLANFWLWPAARDSPFPQEHYALQGFFKDSVVADYFQIRGRDGHAVSKALSADVINWLVEQRNVVLESQPKGLLIALEAEWSPQQLEEKLEACHRFLCFLEASCSGSASA